MKSEKSALIKQLNVLLQSNFTPTKNLEKRFLWQR